MTTLTGPAFLAQGQRSASGQDARHQGRSYVMDNQGSSLLTRMLTLLSNLVGVSYLTRWLPRPSAPPPVEMAARAFQSGMESPSVMARRLENVAAELLIDIEDTRKKIHRYPARIRALGERFTDPIVVAIGPYHHPSDNVSRDHLKPMEKLKQAAAFQCVSEGNHSVKEMYDAVAIVAEHGRSLYDVDVVGGISATDFLTMMFYDACFLVQYLRSRTSPNDGIPQSLLDVFHSKDQDIFHDIMLLENQIPWRVVQAIMVFIPLDLNKFVHSARRYLYEHEAPEGKTFVLHIDYEPPHLLGLLRHCIVGRKDIPQSTGLRNECSLSINKFAEIGITLAANKTNDLVDMGVRKKGPLFADLYLAPLSLDERPSNMLVNMAALELCMTSNFLDARAEESAVCSYLQFLAMLVHREGDVHELRTKEILKGAGFTDKQALDFFSGLNDLRVGPLYDCIIGQIEGYTVKRRIRTKLYAFFYRNWKTIAAVLSAIAAIAAILKLLQPVVIKSS